MRFKLATTCFVIGSVLAPFAAYAADSDTDRSNPRRTTSRTRSLRPRSRRSWRRNTPGGTKHISVDTDKDGVVWMTGTANGQAEVDKAVAIARDTRGVKSVLQQTHRSKRSLRSIRESRSRNGR